jgi:hypothetical protein
VVRGQEQLAVPEERVAGHVRDRPAVSRVSTSQSSREAGKSTSTQMIIASYQGSW